jgi:hypothetical protein
LAALAAAVDFARDGDFEGLCSLGGGNCRHVLDAAGVENVPAEPPVVMQSIVLPETELNGSTQRAGRVLILCNEGSQQPTEILAFFDAGMVRLIEPVYWSGTTINDSSITGGSQTAAVDCSARPSTSGRFVDGIA